MKNFDFQACVCLRNLDFDDMLTMALLHDGMTVTNCSGVLHISQPAVSQRMRKISQSLDFKVFRAEGRKVALTLEGRVFASACKIAVKLITESISL
jgi:LysR family transcriptional activator of glutamate synthase operon